MENSPLLLGLSLLAAAAIITSLHHLEYAIQQARLALALMSVVTVVMSCFLLALATIGMSGA